MNEPENPSIIFHALDREAVITITERNLPHWFQLGAAIFVTFRAADSLPKEVVQRMIAKLHEWLRCRGLPTDLADSILGVKQANHEQLMKQLESKQRRELKKLTDQLFHRSLDDSHGACLFRAPDLARIVADTIRKFDGDRFDLDCLVVMPNHVHVIVQFRQGHGLEIIGQSWMRYSARIINQRLERSGVLWQPEPFDHIIRSPEQFQYLQRYIAENPAKAQLSKGEYLYWSRM